MYLDLYLCYISGYMDEICAVGRRLARGMLCAVTKDGGSAGADRSTCATSTDQGNSITLECSVAASMGVHAPRKR